MYRRAAALLAAPLLLIAACAKEADEGAVEVKTGAEAVTALRSAPDAVAEAGTARLELVMEVSSDGHATELHASGAVDSSAQQMAMEMDMGAVFRELASAGGEDVPPGFDEPWQLVADGSTIYVKAPIFEVLGASGWLSIDPEDLGATADQLGLGAGSFDFTKTLESLRGVVGEPEVVGEEDVRGVPTTHYRASMDLSEALEHAPADQRERLQEALEQIGSTDDLDGAEVPVDIWIDEDDLPRRMRMEMDSMFAALGKGDGSMTMTMEWFDYGDDVDIQIPSADEVTPITEALGGLGAGFGS